LNNRKNDLLDVNRQWRTVGHYHLQQGLRQPGLVYQGV